MSFIFLCKESSSPPSPLKSDRYIASYFHICCCIKVSSEPVLLLSIEVTLECRPFYCTAYIMHLQCCGIGLVVSFFYGITVALNVPIRDIRQLRQDLEKRGSLDLRDAAAELENMFHQHEKRITCVYDLYLDSFTEHAQDSEPFCSSYLGIQPATATSTFITKTYFLPNSTLKHPSD